jgi:hypothetical protein
MQEEVALEVPRAATPWALEDGEKQAGPPLVAPSRVRTIGSQPLAKANTATLVVVFEVDAKGGG